MGVDLTALPSKEEQSAERWRALYVQSRETVKTQVDAISNLRAEAERLGDLNRRRLSLYHHAEDERQALRAENARLRARLEELTEDVIEEWHSSHDPGTPDGDYSHAQCMDCYRYADTPEAIRHVAGTRIGELPCPYLLDMRALGRPVLDDSEEVAQP